MLATNVWDNACVEISVAIERKLAAEFVKPAPPAFARDPMKIDYPEEVHLALIPVLRISSIQFEARMADTIARNAGMFFKTFGSA